MISFKVNIDLNTRALQSKADAATKATQMQLDNDVLKDSNYYIPKDTGNLESSGVRSSMIGEGRVSWDTPYARKLYYNPGYTFSKDRNPNAQGLWFEAAKASKKTDWLNGVKEKYRQYFNGK